MNQYGEKGLLGACLVLRNNNYGSMLQSYATQVMLDRYGFEYHLLEYKKKYTPLFAAKNSLRLFNRVILQEKYNEYQKKVFIKAHPEIQPSVRARAAAFDSFRKRYFKAPITVFHGYEALQKGSRNYSAFLTGSDQLWSPSGLPTNFYNLMFTYEDAKRISYASSFGVKEIPWYQRSRTKAYLERIESISCREESGAAIVKELTGREVPVVADPTMLFSAEEWTEMMEQKAPASGKYIFSYFLGNSKKHRDEVRRFSEAVGLPVVSIHQFLEADLGFGDQEVTDAGPEEFVGLIRNAEYVFTDSFHGSVFSILNHRKFVIFNRYADGNKASKNSRIDSLCSSLGLSSRRYSGDIIADASGEIDYSLVDEKLAEIRKKSRAYLEKAFDQI